MMDPIVVTLLIFALVTTAVLSGFYAFTGESLVSRRIGALTVERAGSAEPSGRSGNLNRLFAALGPYAFGSGEGSIAQTLSFAGLRNSNAVLIFLGARMLFSFGPALLYVVPQVSAGRPLGGTLVRALLIWGGLHVFITSMLKRRARRRIQLIT